MRVQVTLFGGLRHFLPPGSSFNNCEIELPDGATLETLLDKIAIPHDKPFLVLLNDTKVNGGDYAEIEIGASDEIVLLPPIKGG